MCGIAGAVTLDGRALEAGLAARMRDAIQHRGPDGNGEFEGVGAQLAACRLAIVDLEPRGLMPMASADGRYHIVHNGEIYNRLELREELQAQGEHLRTTTDTEVIVALYARHGPQMLDRLDGMFAFAIWDATERRLFAARDRAGEKPLFYTRHDGKLLFGSEPKALFAAGVRPQFDSQTWPELLTFRSVAGSRTPYVGVQELLPGHWLRATGDTLETKQWWSFPTAGARSSAADFNRLLEGSVRRRLIADVPVGTLLSGGLDSSAVTALAVELGGRTVPAFTVRYDDAAADEGEYAEAAAAGIGVEHHQMRVPRGDLPRLIADTAWHMDEPISFNAAAELLAVSRYARKFVRVVLTGEASDELFGGYGRMRLLRYPAFVSLAGGVLAPFKNRFRHGSRWYRVASAARLSRAEWIAASYADGDPNRYSSRPLAEWAPYRAQAAQAALAVSSDPVLQALAYERQTHLPAVLALGDRMTMGAAIEARLPFTDPGLLAFAANARKADLFKGPHGKQPLRQAMVGRLPEVTLNRRKRGWTSPYSTYLREVPELRQWLARVPDHPVVGDSPLGAAGTRAAVDAFLAGNDSRARDAWLIARVVLWHQVCVEGIRYPFDGRAP